MSFNRALIAFMLLMAFGISSHSFVGRGIYPVAVVNFDVVTAKQVAEDSRVAYTYFQNTLRAYGNDPSTLDTAESQLEIKRATLEKLILDKIIYQELRQRVKDDFYAIANQNIDKYVADNQNVTQGAKLLYGLELPDFRNRVLLPQAYREILEGRMFLNNEQFDEWLKDSGSSAQVFILSPELQWVDGSVKVRSDSE